MGRFENGDRYWEYDAGQKRITGGHITEAGDQEDAELPADQQIRDWRFSDWELNRVIRHQLEAGYWPTRWGEGLSGDPAPRALPDARERLRLASDDDLLVYADQLQARGDPRGELVAVQANLLSTPDEQQLKEQEQKLLAEHGWLGPLAGVDPNYLELRWHLGFIRAARLHIGAHVKRLPRGEEVLWQLLQLDDRHTLRHLTLGKMQWGDNTSRGVSALLMGTPDPPPLQTLWIGAFGDDIDDVGEIDVSRAPLGRPDPAQRALPPPRGGPAHRQP